MAPIRPLAWESPYARVAALKGQKDTKKKKKLLSYPSIKIEIVNIGGYEDM